MEQDSRRPHPLFRAFVRAAMDYEASERLPVELPEPADSTAVFAR